VHLLAIKFISINSGLKEMLKMCVGWIDIGQNKVRFQAVVSKAMKLNAAP
jgi:hypothetical protein